MAEKYYLAIDIGASSGRHILGHLEGGKLVLEEVYRFKNGAVEKNGKLVWDHNALFSSIVAGLKECGARGKIPCMVGIDTWGVDYALLDKNGELIGEIYSYRDDRTLSVTKEVAKTVGEERLYKRTGIQEQVFNTIYQLYCDKKSGKLDKAETFLMRLQRGSGVYGLSAMDEVSSRDGIMLLRPFLNVHPDFFKQYLKGKNICWVEDESNHCTDFLRVKMRRFLPDMEAATGISAAKICVAANNLQRTKSFLEDTIANIIADKIHVWGVSGCSFDYAEFLSWHEELRFHILGRLIRRFGAGDYAPEADSLLDLSQNLLNAGFSAQTLGGCHILKQDLRLWIIKEYREENSAYSTDMWEKFTEDNPSVRGIKLPFLLKEALLREK